MSFLKIEIGVIIFCYLFYVVFTIKFSVFYTKNSNYVNNKSKYIDTINTKLT